MLVTEGITCAGSSGAWQLKERTPVGILSEPVDRLPGPCPLPSLPRGKTVDIVARPPEERARIVGKMDCPGLRGPGLDLAVGAVVRHHDVEDMAEPGNVDAGRVPEEGRGPDRRMPDERVIRERDEREALAAETGRLPDVVEECPGKEHVGVHLRPADGPGEVRRNLRGLEGVLREAAGIRVVPAFGRGRFKESRGVVHDP